MLNFDEILLELSYRTPEGIVDLRKTTHLIELKQILKENGVDDPTPYLAVAEYYFSQLQMIDEAKSKKSSSSSKAKKVLDAKIINPETDTEIFVRSALSYDKQSPAYKAAIDFLKKNNVSSEDVEDAVKAEKPKKGQEPEKNTQILVGGELESRAEIEKRKKQEKEKAEQTKKRLYDKRPKNTVMGNPQESDNQVKNDMLKYGFKGYKTGTGKDPAPGSQGSAFNEIISGEGARILQEQPDLNEEQLTRVIVSQFCGSKLGKEQSISSDVVRDLPDDLKNNACASKALIAARSARDKFDRARETTQRLQSEGLLSKNTKMHTFYGADDSKEAQIRMVREAKTIMLPDGTVVNKNDAIAFVAAGGGGANPSDTAVFIQDDKGNVVIKFYSDKTSTSDIQDNSTLKTEIDEKFKQIDSLEKNGSLSKKEADAARAIISNHRNKIEEIEVAYAEGNRLVAENLSKAKKGSGYDTKEQMRALNSGKNKTLKQNFEKATKDSKGNYKKEIVENLPEGCSKTKPSEECVYRALINVVAKGGSSNDQQKVIMKISAILTTNFIDKEETVPPGIDVNSIVSFQRKKVAQSHHKMLKDLDERIVTVGGTKKGLGTVLHAEDVISSFHLTLMDYPPKKYKEGDPESMMGQSFEASMGGDMVNGEILRKCLGVKNTQEFKEKFSVEEKEELTYEFTEEEARKKLKAEGITNPTPAQINNARNVTGMKIFSYAIDQKTGQSKEVGFRVYRGKAGKTSRTSTTMQYSDDMKKCFAQQNK